MNTPESTPPNPSHSKAPKGGSRSLLGFLPARYRTLSLLTIGVVVAGLAYLLFFTNKRPPGWWDDAWTVRKKITLDQQVLGNELPKGHMPLLVRLHAGTFQFPAAKEDGSDIRFVVDETKTVLPSHVEKFDSLMGEGFAWVQLPEFKEGEPLHLSMYYGNSEVHEDLPPAKETYDQNTVLVYHFNERGQPLADSSAGGNNSEGEWLTIDGSYIGSGARFDGVGTLNIPTTPTLAWLPGGEMTWSAWVNTSSLQPNAMIFSRKDGAGSFVIGLDNGNPFVEINGQRSAPGQTVTASTWIHLAVVADPAKTTFYVNGEPSTSLAVPLPGVQGPIQIGKNFVGDLDEMEISNKTRSVGFIKATAISQGSDRMAELVKLDEDELIEGGGGGGEHGYFGVIVKSVTIDAWIVIVILIFMGLGSFYVMYSKAQYLKHVTAGNQVFMENWKKIALNLELLEHGNPEKVRTMGGNASSEIEVKTLEQSPVYRIYSIGNDEIRQRRDRGIIGDRTGVSHQVIESIKTSLEAGVMKETQKLNNLMVLLTIAISGGPFLGLLGTVVGVMITFAAIAAAGEVNVNSIAPGIAAALLATVAGLGVAIPALFGYNYLISQIKNATNDMQMFVGEFVSKVAEFYHQQK